MNLASLFVFKHFSLLIIRFLVALSVLFVSSFSRGGDEIEKEALRKKVQLLFAERNWSQLEVLANDLRTNETRTESGRWLLPEFYAALHRWDKDFSLVPDRAWMDELAVVEKWEKAHPRSITPVLMKADLWRTFGWKAGEPGERLFDERVQLGYEELNDTLRRRKIAVSCPHYYTVLANYGIALEWKPNKAREQVSKVAERWPDYCSAYEPLLLHLSFESEEDDEEIEYIEWLADQNPAGMGEELYARLMWHLSNYHQFSAVLTDEELAAENANKNWTRLRDDLDWLPMHASFDWVRMKKGFEAIFIKYPHSSDNTKAYFKFAVASGDLESLKKIPKSFTLRNFSGEPAEKGRVQALKQWRNNEYPILLQRVCQYMGDLTRTNCVVLDPGGEWVASGHNNGSLSIGRADRRERVFQKDLFKANLAGLAVSPDGKWLAASIFRYAAYKPGNTKGYQPSMVVVYQMDQFGFPKEYIRFPQLRSPTFSLTFTHDSKQLIMGGGRYRKSNNTNRPEKDYEFFVWETGTKNLKKRNQVKEKRYLASASFRDNDELLFNLESSSVWMTTSSSGYEEAVPVVEEGLIKEKFWDLIASPDRERIVLLPEITRQSNRKSNGNFFIVKPGEEAFFELPPTREPIGMITAAQFINSGEVPLLITASMDGWLRFWSGLEDSRPKLMAIHPVSASSLNCMSVVTAGKRTIVAAGDEVSRITVFEFVGD